MDAVCVTGSSGSIGTAVSLGLLEAGVEVVGVDVRPNRWSERIDDATLDVDLRDPDAWLPADVDLILHLAAHSRVRSSMEDPSRAIENVVMTKHVLDHAREHDVPVLLGSSREAYGAAGELPVGEADVRLERCQNPYGASKVGTEALGYAYRHSYGLDVGVLRFSNVYGRYDVYDRVVPIFVAKALAGEELVVYGEEKLLDFVYVDDCVDGVVRAIDRFDAVEGESVNVGSGVGTSLVRLAEVVTEEIDEAAGYRVVEEREGEVGRFVADVGKAERLLGYEPRVDFSTGVERAIEWYRSHREELEAGVGSS